MVELKTKVSISRCFGIDFIHSYRGQPFPTHGIDRLIDCSCSVSNGFLIYSKSNYIIKELIVSSFAIAPYFKITVIAKNAERRP